MPDNHFRGLCTNRLCSEYAHGIYPGEAVPAFCPECGSPVIRRCPNCKTPMSELINNPYKPGPNACKVCGESLRRDVGNE